MTGHPAPAETAPRPGRNKKLGKIILAGILIAALAGGVLWWHQLRTTIKTDNAKVTGEIVNISPRVAGRLEAIEVNEGDRVSPGQVLARLESTQYRIAMTQAEASLELAKANYAKLPADIKSLQAMVDKAREGVVAADASAATAEITLEDARRALLQNQTLSDQGAATHEAVINARSKVSSAEKGLELARANARGSRALLRDAEARLQASSTAGSPVLTAQIKQAQAIYDNAKLSYDNTVIKAPAAGVVIRIACQAGENVNPGQVVVTIADLDSTWITANIDEKKIARVRPGQKVEVTIDAYPGQVFPGSVVLVGNASQSTFALIPTENTSGNYTKVAQRLPVKIKANSGDLVLKPGMSAYVKIHTAQ